jgi:hypothetical protein
VIALNGAIIKFDLKFIRVLFQYTHDHLFMLEEGP